MHNEATDTPDLYFHSRDRSYFFFITKYHILVGLAGVGFHENIV